MRYLGPKTSLILIISLLQFSVPLLGQAIELPCPEKQVASCQSTACCQPEASSCFACCSNQPARAMDDSLPMTREKMSQLCIDLARPHQIFDVNLCFATAIKADENFHSFNPHLTNNHRYQFFATFLI
ncbi:hypothetical protein L0337_39890 [candidate division KSB1 bacterium]|nr:hypothetical protein [candidate division KSB1 bacterium]